MCVVNHVATTYYTTAFAIMLLLDVMHGIEWPRRSRLTNFSSKSLPHLFKTRPTKDVLLRHVSCERSGIGSLSNPVDMLTGIIQMSTD